MDSARFMIDFSGSSYEPFGLFVKRPGFLARWKMLDKFKERTAAMVFYEAIKDLPEYLS